MKWNKVDQTSNHKHSKIWAVQTWKSHLPLNTLHENQHEKYKDTTTPSIYTSYFNIDLHTLVRNLQFKQVITMSFKFLLTRLVNSLRCTLEVNILCWLLKVLWRPNRGFWTPFLWWQDLDKSCSILVNTWLIKKSIMRHCIFCDL